MNCGKDDLAKDCTENSVCINCKSVAEKLKINLDVNHPAWSESLKWQRSEYTMSNSNYERVSV